VTQHVKFECHVAIPEEQGFDNVASLLSELLSLNFQYEDSGRFEEVPAYTAEVGCLEFVLFGIPGGELDSEGGDTENFYLELYDRGIDDTDSELFLSDVLDGEKIDQFDIVNGVYDISAFVVKKLSKGSKLMCSTI